MHVTCLKKEAQLLDPGSVMCINILLHLCWYVLAMTSPKHVSICIPNIHVALLLFILTQYFSGSKKINVKKSCKRCLTLVLIKMHASQLFEIFTGRGVYIRKQSILCNLSWKALLPQCHGLLIQDETGTHWPWKAGIRSLGTFTANMLC